MADNYDAAGSADTAEQNAKAYTDDQIATEVTNRNTAIATAKDEAIAAAADDATTKANAAKQNANAYTDGLIADEATARAAADTELRNSVENEIARATAAETALRNEFAAGDAETLARANAYTDHQVDVLEKNVSGGVAAATALSSVAVSNVKRGEVSVGGGYGYYNNQSALALGAAMGLTDRWSINAGAGLATGDKAQFSFRAGTNYKFKLF